MSKYVNIKSVTFWSGLLLVLKVILKAVLDVDLPVPEDLLFGTGLIGLKKAISEAKTQ